MTRWNGDDVKELFGRHVELIDAQYGIDSIEGTVVKVTTDWVYLDTGFKASLGHIENGDIEVYLTGKVTP